MSFAKFEEEMKIVARTLATDTFLIRPLPSQKEQGGVFAVFRAAEKSG